MVLNPSFGLWPLKITIQHRPNWHNIDPVIFTSVHYLEISQYCKCVDISCNDLRYTVINYSILEKTLQKPEHFFLMTVYSGSIIQTSQFCKCHSPVMSIDDTIQFFPALHNISTQWFTHIQHTPVLIGPTMHTWTTDYEQISVQIQIHPQFLTSVGSCPTGALMRAIVCVLWSVCAIVMWRSSLPTQGRSVYTGLQLASCVCVRNCAPQSQSANIV